MIRTEGIYMANIDAVGYQGNRVSGCFVFVFNEHGQVLKEEFKEKLQIDQIDIDSIIEETSDVQELDNSCTTFTVNGGNLYLKFISAVDRKYFDEEFSSGTVFQGKIDGEELTLDMMSSKWDDTLSKSQLTPVIENIHFKFYHAHSTSHKDSLLTKSSVASKTEKNGNEPNGCLKSIAVVSLGVFILAFLMDFVLDLLVVY